MFKRFFSAKEKGTPQPEENSSPEEPFPQDSEAFLQNPYPFYQALRESNPVYQNPDGFTIISRYEDNLTALSDARLGNSPSRFSTLHPSKKEQFVCANLASNIMPFLDGPAHKEQRKVIGRLFQKQVRELEANLTALSSESCEALPREFEVMSEFATPFALKAVNSLLGFPESTKPQIWSDLFFYLFTQIPSIELRNEVNNGLAEFREWIRTILHSPNAAGLTGDFQHAMQEGTLSEAVAIDTLILLFADGLENVDTGIANALQAFSANPAQWEKLKTDHTLLDSAVDECLRYDPPAQYIARTILEEFEWKGKTLKKDRQVILLLASANRDSDLFENADQFIIERKPNPHLSFGRGKHSCLGGKLVEKEMKSLLSALLKSGIQLERTSEINWQSRKGHRWIQSAHFKKSS